VVVALLTLFAVVAVSLVLHASDHAARARLFREAGSQNQADLGPELLLAYFLGQLLYDAADDESGLYSALRGHSLARLMYGFNDEGANAVAFNGTGRLHVPSAFVNTTGAPAEAKDDYFLINYTCFRNADGSLADGFVRDPERLGTRTVLPAAPDLGDLTRRGPFAAGFNAPYTYPDLNNLFLAAVRADGTVLLPSFHRPWTGFGSLAPDNPHWRDRTRPWLKYLVLRPRPADMGPGFPAPEDAGGDVKNLIGAPGGNDSIWLDLGAPVLQAGNGRQCKPLFAPLIVDLDGRVNLNVHGNTRGPGRQHVSNQGWGPWEVNPRRLSDNPADPAAAMRQREWANLLLGTERPAWPGRYGGTPWTGRTGTPGAPGTLVPFVAPPPLYSAIDFDACQEQAGFAPSAPLQLPGAGTSPFRCFPRFPAGYGNGSAAEREDHPLLYNVFRPVADDRAFTASDLEALLRAGDTGSPALNSELLRLCPLTFADARVRRLVTTHSFDVDRPGVSPWLWQDPGALPYRLGEADLFPTGSAVRFPMPAVPLPVLANSDFTADWRAGPAALGRLDLGRPLAPYPSPDVAGWLSDRAGFQAAQAARQQLAADLFVRLWTVTGAGDPAAVPPPGAPDHDPAHWNALRWLAQLAVNLVDYLDPDDYLTPFNWHGAEWVFGTELPRVVLNEAYAEFTPREPARFDVWVELHNPLFHDPALSDGGAARLVGPGPQPYGIYQLVLTQANADLRRPDNVLGDPDPGEIYALLDCRELADRAPDRIEPADGRYAGVEGSNQGFYVIGPRPFPGGQVRLTHESPRLTYENDQRTRPTILLRRLACPHLPPQPDPGQPGYNPYVTVDYLEDVSLNDARDLPENRGSEGRSQPYAAHPSQRSPQVPLPPLAGQPQHTFFRHNGREPAPPPQAATPGQTLHLPFDWLVHLDRQPISPMELLHVAAVKPHELTQQFKTEAGTFQHYAPWFDQGVPAGRSARLYRLFEFLAVRSRAAGMAPAVTVSLGGVSPGAGRVVRPAAMSGTAPNGAPWRIDAGDILVIDRGTPREENVRVTALLSPAPAAPAGFTADFLKPHAAGSTVTLTTLGDRVPGKINLNTVWDREIFRALCDAQSANGFTQAQVDQVFDHLISPVNPRARTRGPGGSPSAGDRPFLSLAAGVGLQGDAPHAAGLGLEDTLLRSGPATGQRLLQVPGAAHPYQQYELLTKIFNQVTTRSHVFAVWLTVGFFEVTDAMTRPVRLGAEVGRAEGRHVRHRLFAVVDRSVLVGHPGPQPAFDLRAPSPGTAPSSPRAARMAVPYFSIID
jgi:hypothetical protein